MSGGVPAGWVLVPVEPTEAMVYAAVKASKAGLSPRNLVYDAIAATPTPPIEGRDADVEQLKQALEDVCNPLAYLKRMAEAEGAKLGGMAYSIANDIATVQGIARAALQALGERPMQTDAEVAAKLTDKQREVMLKATRWINDEVGVWFAPPMTIRALARKGICDLNGMFLPLGLRVAQHLKQENAK